MLHNLTSSLDRSQDLLEWVLNQPHFTADDLAGSVEVSDARRRGTTKTNKRVKLRLASVSSRGKRIGYNELRSLLISYENNNIRDMNLRMNR